MFLIIFEGGCAFQKDYNLKISILVDKYDSRMFSPKWSEHLNYAYNPGFSEVPSKNLLKEEIQKCLDNKEQVILLLNRRGYSSFITCSNCGYKHPTVRRELIGNKFKSGETPQDILNKLSDFCPSCRTQMIKE